MTSKEFSQAPTREDLRRKRELEEARKSGLIPAEKDEEGRDINPHIPQYIARAPWYLNNEQPSLKHQRRSDGTPADVSRISVWYTRGLKDDGETRKFKKGACQNCGATTHKSADCVERPRAKGARWTGQNIKSDEHIPSEDITDFEAKRDRWGGYDPSRYKFVVQEYSVAEEEERRRKIRAELRPEAEIAELEPTVLAESPPEEAGESDSDSDQEPDAGGTKIQDFDVTNAPVGTKDDRTRTTTRNLRIREDTAKYLINLDLESAFYDPKTRSMRGDPTRGLSSDVQEKILYRGDNAVRNTGESQLAHQYDAFAWEAYKHGQGVHTQAHPTQLELAYRDDSRLKKVMAKQRQQELLKKYGGVEHLQVPADVRNAQTEVFTRYEETEKR